MTRLLLLSGLLIAATGFVTAQTAQHVPDLNLSGLTFIENQGQWSDEAQFLVRTGGLDAWVTSDGLVFDFYQMERQEPHARSQDRFGPERSPILGDRRHPDAERHGHVVRMAFEGARGETAVGELPQNGYHNYFLGNDPDRWASYVPLYGEVVQGLYDGIDMRLYKDQGFLRYDLVVQPGADVSQIRMHLDGADGVSITPEGDLAMQTSLGEVRHAGLLTYQEVDGSREVVPSSFLMLGDDIVGFEADGANPALPLIIDPLIFSSFLGGSLTDAVRGIGLGPDGTLYASGTTESVDDFPGTVGAYRAAGKPRLDIFVARFNEDGTELLSSSLLGGSDTNRGMDVLIDDAGYQYVTGTTTSPEFPTTPGAFSEELTGARDVVVVKLNPDGSNLEYSTYIGGSGEDDVQYGLSVDAGGNAFFVGVTPSSDFPTTEGSFETKHSGGIDGFLAKLSVGGDDLVYSTFISGGAGWDDAWGLAVNSDGYAYVTGATVNDDFPTTEGAYVNRGDGFDVYVAKFTPDGSSLVFASVFGGSIAELPEYLVIDAHGNAYITGITGSADFPVTEGSYATTLNGEADAFVAKLSSDGSSLVYSTYLGGSAEDRGLSVNVDGGQQAHVVGVTQSNNFPTTANAFDSTFNNVWDGFVAQFSADGSTLMYSTFIGGSNQDLIARSVLDEDGNIYLGGITLSADFPVTPGAFQETLPGPYSGFVMALESPKPVSTEGEIAANTVTLDAAYPNPFQQQTTIGFTLPEAGEVQLVIYDMLGRQVARLVDGNYAAGEHSVTFDGSGLAAGSYFVVLRAGAERQSQMVTLLR